MEANKAPLCVFCLSPSFTVLPYQSSAISAPKRPAISRLRRGECSYPRIRPRFKPNLRRGTDALAKYLLGRVNVKRRETSLKEVLGALKEVWISQNNKFKSLLNSNNDMDERRKISCVPSSENYSPVLLRRRLSAPETIMRKHILAQQRTESQDSDATQTSECKSCQLRMDIGSDSNLSKKRDLGLMRKSTLLKRLWGNSKSLIEKEKRFPGAYSEWQYTCGKLSVAKSTHSLNSVHSSPEHLKSLRSLSGEEFRTTSLSNSRKVSPKHMYEKNKNVVKTSPMRKISICNANQDMNTHITYKASISNVSRSSSVTTSGNRISTTNTTNTPKTTDSDTSTRRTNTSTTIYSDNSDSAYTNSRSNFSTNNNSETCSSRTQTYTQENTEINENLSESEFALNINTVNMFNNNNSKSGEKHVNINESSTQTTDTANLNVISNVQLSQSTLNLIFDQVLQDVQNKQPNVININTLSANIPVKEEETISEAKVINVQQIPSFYLNRKDDSIISPQHNQIIKYMISNVGTGSAYSKPAEVPQIVVPRFSALPRSASMEVNTSSGDSTDKESDTVSLVDSLEDPFSPRNNNTLTKYDEKPVRGDLSLLLPDNSDKRKNKTPQKPSAFFIPIESDKKQEGKSVADHLPAKVKEKLSKRQLKREQKVQYAKSNLASPRSDSNYISASDTGNQITFSVSNSDYVDTKCAPILSNPNKTRKKMKTILPNIQTFKRDSKDTTRYTEREKFKDNFNKPKRKSFSRYDKLVDNLSTNLKTKPYGYQSHAWVPKSRTRENTPIRSELLCDLPRRVYHKSELNNLNKRAEILEIMEYVNDERNQNYNKGKSKIPILVPQKLPKIERKSQKPTYLDFDKMHVIDPKIDRLIANILIDTLKNGNSSDDKNYIFKLSNENIAQSSQIQSKLSGNKYQQIFEVIPEELSLQSSAEINTNINKTTNGNIIENKAHSTTEQIIKCNKLEVTDTVKSTDQNQKPCKGKEAISMDDSLTVPQGWITFYMLHKNQGSPDSTSDEGSNKSEKLIKSKTNAIIKKKMNGGTKNSEEPHVQIQEKQINAVPEYNYGANKLAKKDKHDTTIAGNVSSSDIISDNVNLSATSNVARIPKKNVFRKNNKNVNNDRNKPNGWSVTVTGTSSYGQVAPNVEMRLKFPLQNEYGDQCQSDSGFGEERITENLNQSCHLTKRLKQNICGSVANANTTEDNYKNGRLPTINQKNQKRTSKRCDSSLSSSMVPMEPRQTKTSTRRYILNRPRNVGPASPNLDKDFFFNLNAEKQLAAILSRFPDILSVSGNGINPEHKPKVTTMSERDITRQVYANPR